MGRIILNRHFPQVYTLLYCLISVAQIALEPGFTGLRDSQHYSICASYNLDSIFLNPENPGLVQTLRFTGLFYILKS